MSWITSVFLRIFDVKQWRREGGEGELAHNVDWTELRYFNANDKIFSFLRYYKAYRREENH